MLTKKQLKDAVECGIDKPCSKCNCRDIRKRNPVCKCVSEVAKTALAYREMLERLEWRLFAGEHGFVDNCPICGGSKPDGIFGGHWPDCELVALLKESEGKEG